MRTRFGIVLVSVLILNSHTMLGQRDSDQSSFWLNIFPFNGNVFNLTRDAIEAETIFAVTDRGLFATPNAGITWNPIFSHEPPDRRDKITWGTFTIDASNPNYRMLSLSSDNSGTLWRSVNMGKQWNAVGENVIRGAIYSVEISPTSSQLIYAATSAGLFKSLNAGKSWGPLYNYPCSNLRIDPENSEKIYFLSWESGDRKFLISRDGGKTIAETKISFETVKWDYNAFTGKRSASKDVAKPNQVRGYSLNPKNSAVIFAACGYSGVSRSHLVQSTDGGKTWTEMFREVERAAWDYSPHELNTIFVAAKMFDSDAKGSVYKLLRSQDNGSTWSEFNYPTDTDPTGLLVAKDGSIYVCADGIFRSIDAGSTWSRRHFGLPSHTSGYELLASDANSEFYVAFKNGFWVGQDLGTQWQSVPLFSTREKDLALKQIIINQDGSRLFLARHHVESVIWKGGLAAGILIRQSHSQSDFETLNLPSLPYFVSTSTADPTKIVLISAPKAQYYGDLNSPSLLSFSDDAGFSWTDVEWSKSLSKESTPFRNTVGIVAVHPQKQLALACISDRLLLSNNAGLKWIDVSGKVSKAVKAVSPNAGTLRSILFDPDDATAIFLVTQYGGVVRSADGGKSWKSMKPPYPKAELYDFAILPTSSTFIATTPKGIFRSSDRGTSWKSLDKGLLFGDKPHKIVTNESFTVVGGSTGIYLLTNAKLLRTLSGVDKSKSVDVPESQTTTDPLTRPSETLSPDEREKRKSTKLELTLKGFSTNQVVITYYERVEIINAGEESFDIDIVDDEGTVIARETLPRRGSKYSFIPERIGTYHLYETSHDNIPKALLIVR